MTSYFIYWKDVKIDFLIIHDQNITLSNNLSYWYNPLWDIRNEPDTLLATKVNNKD